MIFMVEILVIPDLKDINIDACYSFVLTNYIEKYYLSGLQNYVNLLPDYTYSYTPNISMFVLPF